MGPYIAITLMIITAIIISLAAFSVTDKGKELQRKKKQNKQ